MTAPHTNNPATMRLVGHLCPLGVYPSSVIPVLDVAGAKSAVFIDGDKVTLTLLPADADIVLHTPDITSRLSRFDSRTDALFASAPDDVLSYTIAHRSQFLRGLLEAPGFASAMPFIRLSLAKHLYDVDIVRRELIKCVLALQDRSSEFAESWYLAERGRILADWHANDYGAGLPESTAALLGQQTIIVPRRPPSRPFREPTRPLREPSTIRRWLFTDVQEFGKQPIYLHFRQLGSTWPHDPPTWACFFEFEDGQVLEQVPLGESIWLSHYVWHECIAFVGQYLQVPKVRRGQQEIALLVIENLFIRTSQGGDVGRVRLPMGRLLHDWLRSAARKWFTQSAQTQVIPDEQLVELEQIDRFLYDVDQDVASASRWAVRSQQPRIPDLITPFERHRTKGSHVPSIIRNISKAGVADPAEMLLIREQYERLHKALHQLDPMEQEILRLTYFGGFSYRDIADMLSEKASFIRKRHANAVTKLGRLLRPWE